MKILVTLSASLISSTLATACPNLAGNFACENIDDPNLKSIAQVAQKATNNVVTYDLHFDGTDKFRYVADGLPKVLPTSEGETSIVTICNGTSLQVERKNTSKDSGIIDSYKMVFEATATGFTLTTYVTQAGSQSYIQENQIVCAKQ